LLVTEDELLKFVQNSIKSVWALEMLLLFRRERQRAWDAGDLVRELRSSDSAVAEALTALHSAGFVTVTADGRYHYGAALPEMDDIAAQIERLYGERPLAMAKAIMSAPNEKLRIFSDAFKLKDP
jgi:DNA-binding IclR family transcriptional regulator